MDTLSLQQHSTEQLGIGQLPHSSRWMTWQDQFIDVDRYLYTAVKKRAIWFIDIYFSSAGGDDFG